MIADRLNWQADGFTIGDFTYREQPEGASDTAPDAFHFYKSRDQVEQFDRFFAESELIPRRVLELGLWDGGSAAFWPEVLPIEAYAGIDLQTRGDSPYFSQWLRERGGGRVSTHWGVDQTDGPALRRIIAERNLGPLDLVLDDCSHLYEPTLASFELLFGLVREGGWYVIEDWAWALEPAFQSRSHPWGVHRALHPVVHRLIDLHGSRPDLVPSIRVFPAFVALERGPGDASGLSVGAATARRARPWLRIAEQRARRYGGPLKQRLLRR